MSIRNLTVPCLCMISALMVWHHTASAVAIFQLDNFQSGTVEGWSGGAQPTNISTGGPAGAGDAFLQITSNGAGGPGSKPATHNGGAGSNWYGDYSGLDVRAITLDMMNAVSSDPLEMRLVLFSGDLFAEDRWTSVIAEPVPNDGQWHQYRFYISESDLTPEFGTISYNDLINQVYQVMVRHDPGTPSPGGETATAVLGIDNVRLVPNIDTTTFDALVAAIAAGTDGPAWDINHDNLVNVADLDELRNLGGLINLPSQNPYLPGDADLSGTVDGADFIAWNANKFTSTASWSGGDFNADGQVDGADFILWNANKFTSSDAAAVPEPAADATWLMMLMALFAASLLRFRTWRQALATSVPKTAVGRSTQDTAMPRR